MHLPEIIIYVFLLEILSSVADKMSIMYMQKCVMPSYENVENRLCHKYVHEGKVLF